MRLKTTAFTMVLDRFLAKVEIPDNPDECWKWLGGKTSGYGSFHLDGVSWTSNRAAAFFFLPDYNRKLFVLHKCDNPECSNPKHLFMGTHQDNMKDMVTKNRQNNKWTKNNKT